VACDLPFLRVEFLRHLIASRGDADLVVPHTRDGYQPLCALYARRVVDHVATRLAARRLDMMGLLHELHVREIGPDEVASYDPEGLLFLNVNTPEDYARAERLASRRPT
jgi:molybdopterin-guanine dinucleotide biosynthesis protein A